MNNEQKENYRQYRVTKNECKIARQRVHKLISNLQKNLKYRYKFSYKLVGSGAWGTMIKDQDGKYDLDYQLILTKNSPYYKQNKKYPHPTEIKKDFILAFNKLIKDKECIENSTTAITLINQDNKPYTIDFVIIREEREVYQIIRRNNKKEFFYKNEFTWNKLQDLNQAYTKFKALYPEEKRKLIEERIISKKIKEKKKSDGDITKRSSMEIFIQEINNYGNKKFNS